MIRNLDQLVAYAKGLGATHMTLSNYHCGGIWKLDNTGQVISAETIRWRACKHNDGYEVLDLRWQWDFPLKSMPPSMIEIGSVLTDEHFLRSNELIGGELGNLTQT